jgi:pyruvate carboxylase
MIKDFIDSRSGNADVYKHEIPGGQYTNLQFQVSAQIDLDKIAFLGYVIYVSVIGYLIKVKISFVCACLRHFF